MLVIRKIVDYLKDELVPDINKNDVANITTSISGTVLTINIVMGDGTVKSTNVNLPEPGGESGPYPTGVTLSLSGTTLNFSMAMSNGTPINGSVDLNSAFTLSKPTNNQIKLQSSTVNVVDDVTTQIVSGNTLRVEVNGVAGQVALPISDGLTIEELNQNNFPNDWVEGDILYIKIAITIYINPSFPSWTDTLEDPSVDKSSSSSRFYMIPVISGNSSSDLGSMYITNRYGGDSPIAILSFNPIYINSINSNVPMLSYTAFTFNGTSSKANTSSILLKSSDWIEKMYRIRGA